MTFLARPRYIFTSVVLCDDQESSDEKAAEMRRKEEVKNKMKDLLLKMTKVKLINGGSTELRIVVQEE